MIDLIWNCIVEEAEFVKWGMPTRWYFNITNYGRLRVEKSGKAHEYMICL